MEIIIDRCDNLKKAKYLINLFSYINKIFQKYIFVFHRKNIIIIK